LISNDLPQLRDGSGALASRLIIMRFTRSFCDREDSGRFDRLSRELPRILLWALAGWQRLRRQGPVMQPQSGRELLAAMEELKSPISAFLDDRCVLDPREIVSVATLYKVWRSWCQEHGRDAVGVSHRLAPTCTRRVPVCPKAGFARDRSGSLTIGESGFARR
jgi:putative DNA primase/helicase